MAFAVERLGFRARQRRREALRGVGNSRIPLRTCLLRAA